MKKMKKTAGRMMSLFLAAAVTFSGVPVYGQEYFTSESDHMGIASDFDETQTTFVDDSAGAGDSAQDIFTSETEEDVFDAGEPSADEELDYIKGRPLTEEERAEQLAPIEALESPQEAPVIGSELGISAYALYPEKYDVREQGIISPVKNQKPFGICWAFGLASVLETSLLAQGRGLYDLSEEHLAYFFANRQDDPLGNTPEDKNIHVSNYHEGGNDYLASIFLSTWSGMTTEEDVPLPTNASHTADYSGEIPAEKAYNAAAYLTNASFSDYTIDRMKLMIMEGNSVSFMYTMDERYYNPDTGGCSYPYKVGVNHVGVAVGWDDTYSAKNFPANSNVTSDGAWIVKNSWGTGWGDGGYFYLSYFDKNISALVTADAVDDVKYENNYFYDGTSSIQSIKLQPGQSMASVFEVKAGEGKGEVLGEVNVVTLSDNAEYSIQIYTNLTKTTDPTSGTPAYSVPYEFYQPLAGVQTVEVPEVTLMQGTKYSVVVTNSGSEYFKMGCESIASYKDSAGNDWFRTSPGIKAGEGFYKGASDTAAWTDLINTQPNPASPRIKAHTRTLDTPVTPKLTFTADKTELEIGGTIQTKVAVTPSSVGYFGLTYVSSSPDIASVDQNGVVTGLKEGTAVITCKSSDSAGLSSSVTIKVKSITAPKLKAVSDAYNRISLSWNKISGVSGYTIYRKETGKDKQKLADVSATATVLRDTSVKTGVKYTYTIIPFITSAGVKLYGKESTAVSATAIPATPVFTVKASAAGYNQVTWQKVAGATSYKIYRKVPSGSWKAIATVSSSVLKYNDKKITAAASYQYTVRAFRDASGVTTGSKYTTGDVIKAAPALMTVSSVKAEANGIRVRWTAQKKCDGYRIYRKTKNGSWKSIAIISNGNLTSYLDKTAVKGVSYYYAVKAFVIEPYGKTYSKYKSSPAVKR